MSHFQELLGNSLKRLAADACTVTSNSFCYYPSNTHQKLNLCQGGVNYINVQITIKILCNLHPSLPLRCKISDVMIKLCGTCHLLWHWMNIFKTALYTNVGTLIMVHSFVLWQGMRDVWELWIYIKIHHEMINTKTECSELGTFFPPQCLAIN